MAIYSLIEVSSNQVVNIIDWDPTSSYSPPDGYTLELYTTESYFFSQREDISTEYINTVAGDFIGNFTGELTGSITINGKSFDDLLNETDFGSFYYLSGSELPKSASFVTDNDINTSNIKLSFANYDDAKQKKYVDKFNNILDNNITNYIITLSHHLGLAKRSYLVKNTTNNDSYFSLGVELVYTDESGSNINNDNNFNDLYNSRWNLTIQTPDEAQSGKFYGDFFIDGDSIEEVFAIAPKTCGKLKYSETKLEDRNQNPTYGYLPSAPFFEFDVETSVNGESANDQWKVSKPTQVIIPRRAIGSTAEQIDYEGKLFAILEDRLAWSRITFSQENSDSSNQAFTSAFKEFEIITMRYVEKRFDPSLQTERYYEKNWGDKDFSETPATQIWTNHPSNTLLDRDGYFIITVNQVRPTTLANYSNPPINGDLFSVCIALKEYRKSITIISGSQQYMVPWWADKTTIIAVAPGGGGGGGAWGYPHSEDIHSLYEYSLRSEYDPDAKNSKDQYIDVTYPCISQDDHFAYSDGGIFEVNKNLNLPYNEYKNLPDPSSVRYTKQKHFRLRETSLLGNGSPRNGTVDYTKMQNNYDNLIGYEYVTGGSGGSGGTVAISEFDKYELPQGTILDIYIGSPGKGGQGVEANDVVTVLDRAEDGDPEYVSSSYILFNRFLPRAISPELQNYVESFDTDYYEDDIFNGFVKGYSHKTKYGDENTAYSFAYVRYQDKTIWDVLRPVVGYLEKRWNSFSNVSDKTAGIDPYYVSYLGSFKNLVIGDGFKLSYIRERGGYKNRIRTRSLLFDYWDPFVSWYDLNFNPFSFDNFLRENKTDLFDNDVLEIDEEHNGVPYTTWTSDNFTWFSYGWENNKKIEQSDSKAKYHGKNGGDVFIIDPFGKEILRAKGGVGGSAGYGTRAFYDDFFRFSWNPDNHIMDTGIDYDDPKTYVIPGTPNVNGSNAKEIRPGGLGGYGVHMPIGRNLASWLNNNLDLAYGGPFRSFNTAPPIPYTDDSGTRLTTNSYLHSVHKHPEALPDPNNIDTVLPYMTLGNYDFYSNPNTFRHRIGFIRPRGDNNNFPSRLAPPGGGGGSGASWQGLDLRSFPRNGSETGVPFDTNKDFLPYYDDSKSIEGLLKRQVESINSHVSLGLGGQLIPTTNGFTDTFLVNDFDSDGVLHQLRLERGGNGGYGKYYGQNNFSTQTWPQQLQNNFNNLSNTLPEDVSDRWGVGGGGGAAEYLSTHSDKNNLGQPGIPIKGQDGADGGPGVVIIIAEKNSL